jgi:hypothetical protein
VVTVGVLLALLLVGAVDGSAATPPGREGVAAPTVVLYGDSLAVESEAAFRGALAAAGISEVHTETYGGTALCDWLQRMRDDVVDLRPDTVVIELSGNAFTPCMHDADDSPLAGDAYYAKYASDAGEALRIFAATGAHVYLVGTPISRRVAEAHGPDAGRLNALYSDIAALTGAEYVDAGSAVLHRGQWTETMPCLDGEACTGGTDPAGVAVNVVRAPDGMHFCPTAGTAVQGVTDTCAVWSSGAHRFGTAMAEPVITAFRRRF